MANLKDLARHIIDTEPSGDTDPWSEHCRMLARRVLNQTSLERLGVEVVVCVGGRVDGTVLIQIEVPADWVETPVEAHIVRGDDLVERVRSTVEASS